MKKNICLIILLKLTLAPIVGICQSDSVFYNYNDTCIATTLTEYDKLLKHFIPDKKETTILYKTNLLDLAKKQLNFAIEHKLKNNWSLEHEAIILIKPYSNYFTNTIPKKEFGIYLPTKNSRYHVVLSSNLKYYHNIDKRIKKGKNTNGFSGNYLTIGLTTRIGIYNPEKWFIDQSGLLGPYKDYTIKQKIMFSDGKKDITQSIAYINAGYGLQRRIGNVGYLGAEIKMGVGTNKYFNTLYLVPEINAKLGFALNSLKIKRK